jgi:pyruvate dehydrogenase (quinone)
MRGIRVTSGDQVADAWREALSSDRPVLFEAVTDPEVPPLPPHIRFEQAKGIMSALASGDEDRGRIIKESIKGKLHEFTTR